MATTYGTAHSLKDGNGFIFISISLGSDPAVAITQNYYQHENAIFMLEELRQEFYQNYPELTKDRNADLTFSSDRKFLQDVCGKYNKAGSESSQKLAETQQKVDSTAAAMKTNVAGMVLNVGQAQELETKSAQLTMQANMFSQKSAELESQYRWRKIKFWLMVGGIIAIIIGLVIWGSYGTPENVKKLL